MKGSSLSHRSSLHLQYTISHRLAMFGIGSTTRAVLIATPPQELQGKKSSLTRYFNLVPTSVKFKCLGTSGCSPEIYTKPGDGKWSGTARNEVLEGGKGVDF